MQFIKVFFTFPNTEKDFSIANDVSKFHLLKKNSEIFRLRTLRICHTYCFSTATMVTWTHLNVNFIRTFPVLFNHEINY